MPTTTSHSKRLYAVLHAPSPLLAVTDAPRARPHHEEDNLQMACVRWFDYQHHDLSLLLHHSPNEGLLPRTARDGAKRKAMGVRAGFPDLVLLVPSNGFSYLCVELKTRVGRQSPAQREYQEAVEQAGGRYVVCRSVDDFIREVTTYLDDAEPTSKGGSKLISHNS